MKSTYLLLVLLCMGCQQPAEDSAYYLDVVCQIYTKVNATEDNHSMKEGEIYEQIMTKLPEFEE